jgi:AcrR family transcriptional regulator
MSRKERILKAAIELFARQGFNGTSTSMIAQRADVAQGTVFHHFRNKENLLVAICDDLVKDYIQGITEASGTGKTGWEALEGVLRFSQEFRRKRHDSIRVAFRDTQVLEPQGGQLHEHFCSLTQQIIEVKRRCIEKGQADGSIRQVPVLENALLLHIIMKGILHVETLRLVKLPDLDSEILEFCRRSLATRPGTPVTEIDDDAICN